MHTFDELAELIFPEVTMTLEDLDRMYPDRDLPEGAKVTRFAPSPTGFLHTGSLFTALVAQKVAAQSGGVFYTRLEDTDTKREVEGSGTELLDQLAVFSVIPNEGYYGDHEKGNYGPYQQSKRAEIYKVVIKELIRRGRAYPCFCSHEELDALRKVQEASHVIPGYYQQYAKCRFLTLDEQFDAIRSGKKFVIRFKSMGDHNLKKEADDLVRGHLYLSQNDQDIVIYKSDGLPTYHFAHLVDDHYMHTNVVSRGEEWLPSLPIHLELFETMGWKAPEYAHLPVIMKLDNGNKRKLSKRKDDEAAIAFFLKDGYPVEAIKEYLYTIANSNYEEWHKEHPELKQEDFVFTFAKMSLDGALFDIEKMQNISKEIIATYSAERMLREMLNYTEKYDEEFHRLIVSDPDYFKEIMNIEKDRENPRKDYIRYGEIFDKVKFFYEPYYSEMIAAQPLPFNPNFDKDLIVSVLDRFAKTLNIEQSEQDWFSSLKQLAAGFGFALNAKEYKKNPGVYKGHVGDVAEMIRIALTSSRQSPNMYYILKILKNEKVSERIQKVIAIIR